MSQTVRLSVQLWDPARRIRMSIHRDVLTSELQTSAGEIVSDMLPSFTRHGKPKEKSRSARAGAAQSGSMFLRRHRSGRR